MDPGASVRTRSQLGDHSPGPKAEPAGSCKKRAGKFRAFGSLYLTQSSEWGDSSQLPAAPLRKQNKNTYRFWLVWEQPVGFPVFHDPGVPVGVVARFGCQQEAAVCRLIRPGWSV